MLETPAPIDPGLDVVHRAAGGGLLAGEAVGDCRRGEDCACSGRGSGEDVITVGGERTVEQLNYFEHRYLVGRTRERVAALHATLRAEDAAAPERGYELLKELRRDVAAAGNLADWNRVIRGPRELGQSRDRVRRLGRNRNHPSTLPD